MRADLLVCAGIHSHSILSMHRNALIYKRKNFLLTGEIRLSVRQIFSLMISKGNSRDSNLARFRRLSITIGRFFSNLRQPPYGNPPKKRPSLLIDQCVCFVMIVASEDTVAALPIVDGQKVSYH